MGLRRNPERERLIYRYWVQGYTIDEISMLTGIPRSSVGYYVKKFNKKYGKNGRLRGKLDSTLMDDESLKMDESKLIGSVMLKAIGCKNLLDAVSSLMREGRYKDLYYLLKSMKLIREALQPLMLTPEEEKVVDKLLKQFAESYLQKS